MKHLRPIHALRRKRPRPVIQRLRRGSVLIIVLVVILLLTYGVYGFTERMLAETEAADAHGRAVQAMAYAQSGVELAASAVSSRAADPENPVSLYHVPTSFAGVIMRQSPTPTSVGRFSLVAPVEGDTTFRQIRFGLADESGKLNLNAIPSMNLEEIDQHYLLMYLPGMTDDIADAILDYIDDDDEMRPLGAESDFYEGLTPPYFAKNGPLESLEELLLVRGVTPELLYGEDANRNGLLDPAEDDGAASVPMDDGDGVLLPGWRDFLTIHSRETNLRPDGSKKIHVNQGMLTDLYDAIEPELGEDAARFIVAYRMYGPADGEADPLSSGGGSGQSSTGNGTSSGGTSPSGSGSGSGSGGSSSSGSGSGSSQQPTADEAAQMDRLAGNLARAIGGAQEGDAVTRGGLDLSKGAKYEIKSLYDLIGREVTIQEESEDQGNGQNSQGGSGSSNGNSQSGGSQNGRSQGSGSQSGGTQSGGTQSGGTQSGGSQSSGSMDGETLVSPWTSGSILTDFPVLLDLFSLTENSTFDGRLNVNEARVEVLYGLPGMPPELADSIVSARIGAGGEAQSEAPERRTTAWLVAHGIADLATMRHFDRFLTGRGDVFKVQSVGYFDGGGPTARVEAVIDGTVIPARIVSFRDLTDLGRGYAPSQLLPAAGQTGF